MSGLTKLGDTSAFVRELLILNGEQVIAKRAGDLERFNELADDMALLMRYHREGRFEAWLAGKAARQA